MTYQSANVHKLGILTLWNKQQLLNFLSLTSGPVYVGY